MEPEKIEITDEADAMLTELCVATRLGRGRLIGVALEYMLEAYIGVISGGTADPTDPILARILDRVASARTVPQITEDAIEIVKMRL